MAYLERKGFIFNPVVVILSIATITIFHFQADWDRQVVTFNELIPFNLVIINSEFTFLLFLLVLSLIIVNIWYIYGKTIAPRLLKITIRIFGGWSSEPFIDIDINKQNITIWKYLKYYLNFSLLLFTMDFFISNTILYRPNKFPTLLSLFIAVAILSLIEPLFLVYDSVGVRAYNSGNSEVLGVTSILDRFVFRLLQTGGLLGTFASITFNSQIIDQIPDAIRVIFIRTLVLSTMLLFIHITFFQPKAIYKDWMSRAINPGNTTVKIRKRITASM